MKREEAIEKIKAWDFLDNNEKEVLETLIPELKESEDEKIRKAIINFLIDINNGAYTKSELEIASWIAWLEKQGKHHIACSEEQMKVLDEVLNFAANHESSYWNYYIFETLNSLIRQLKN